MAGRAGLIFFILTWWPLLAIGNEAPDARFAQDERVLVEVGILPTPAGALAYLESLIPAGDPNAVADGLVEQLGDDAYERREQAAARLIQLPSLPREKLEVALESQDLEIRWRARSVLSRLSVSGPRSVLAALRVAAKDPPERTLDVLLEFAALGGSESLQATLHQALGKVANETHIPRLRTAARIGPELSRIAAACTLQRIDDDAGRDALAEVLATAQPRAALTAAKRLGNLGDRRALAALSKLLESDDPAVAEDSALFINALVDRDFGYSSFDGEVARVEVIARMQRWLAENAADAPLVFPIAEPQIVRGDLSGHTLLATGSLGFVAELDVKGKEVWRYPVVAWSAEKLLSGNVLIASYQSNQIVEIDKTGAVVWSLNGTNAMRAKPLADGHILVADYGGRRVVEFGEDRQEVWSLTTPDNCFDVERLPNGHTVFCCPNLIREVDGDGQAVRDLAVAGRANSLQVLPNGRWLIANFQKNQVQEYDRSGKLVWSLDEPAPCDAFRVKNGKTLVTSNRRAIEVAADGKTVNAIAEARYGCARQ